MKDVFSICAACLYLSTASAATPPPEAGAGSVAGNAPFPLQLEMRVPIEPTAFSSAGRTYLTYELYLTNFSASPMTFHRIEVLDADETIARPIAVFEDGQMDVLLQPVGAQTPSTDPNLRQLGAGATVMAFMWISFDLKHPFRTDCATGCSRPTPH